MIQPIYIPHEPTIGDDRYRNLIHKELLDPLRIIHFKYYGKDPAIQYLQAPDGYMTMFENGRFLPTRWYLVRGKASYKVQFSCSFYDNFTGSILITSDISSPCDSSSFSYIDDDYISLLTGYINKVCNGNINLILSDYTLKTLSFGHISLPNHTKGEYSIFIDCATEQINKDIIGERNIIFVGDDIKENFPPDEIQKGDKMIEHAKEEVAKDNNISLSELEGFNKRVRQKILKVDN